MSVRFMLLKAHFVLMESSDLIKDKFIPATGKILSIHFPISKSLSDITPVIQEFFL